MHILLNGGANLLSSQSCTATFFHTVLHPTRRESAGEKMLRELKSQGVKPAMPWDVGMSQPEAAHRLGSFLGVSSANPLLPGEVIVMSKDQMTALLHATASGADAELQRALFVHADSVSDRYFGKDVCFRGIIEFSNVCQLDCGYCGIR